MKHLRFVRIRRSRASEAKSRRRHGTAVSGLSDVTGSSEVSTLSPAKFFQHAFENEPILLSLGFSQSIFKFINQMHGRWTPLANSQNMHLIPSKHPGESASRAMGRVDIVSLAQRIQYRFSESIVATCQRNSCGLCFCSHARSLRISSILRQPRVYLGSLFYFRFIVRRPSPCDSRSALKNILICTISIPSRAANCHAGLPASSDTNPISPVCT